MTRLGVVEKFLYVYYMEQTIGPRDTQQPRHPGVECGHIHGHTFVLIGFRHSALGSWPLCGQGHPGVLETCVFGWGTDPIAGFTLGVRTRVRVRCRGVSVGGVGAWALVVW